MDRLSSAPPLALTQRGGSCKDEEARQKGATKFDRVAQLSVYFTRSYGINYLADRRVMKIVIELKEFQ